MTTPTDWSDLSPAQLDAAKNGSDPFTAAPEAPVEEDDAPASEPEESPAEEAAETPVEEAQEPAEPAPTVDDSPNFKAMRQKVAQMQALLNDPQQLAQQAARLGYQLTPQQTAAMADAAQGGTDPFAAFDPQVAEALKGALDQIVGPLHQKLEQYEAHAKTSEERAAIAELDKELPGFSDAVARFDERLPTEAHKFNPMDKFLITQGVRLVDPTERQSLVAELLDQLAPEERQALLAPHIKGEATQMLAAQIKPGAKQGKPVTLSGASAARDNDITPDVSRLNTSSYGKLSPAQRDKLLG